MFIVANSNSMSKRAVEQIPELRSLGRNIKTEHYVTYSNGNDPRNAVGVELRTAIADCEGVDVESVRVVGSGLAIISRLAGVLNRKSVSYLEYDFSHYSGSGIIGQCRNAMFPSEIMEKSISTTKTTKAATKYGEQLFYLTVPCLNPGLTKTSIDIIKDVVSARDDALAICDAAYCRFAGITERGGKLAAENERILYLQPSSKDLCLSGARLSWLVGHPSLLKRIEKAIQPYEASLASQLIVMNMLQQPQIINALMNKQREALRILINGLSENGFVIKSGLGPWVLVNLGAWADTLVSKLEERNILIQSQTSIYPGLRGWVRISATLPDEAAIIVRTLSSLARCVSLPHREAEVWSGWDRATANPARLSYV